MTTQYAELLDAFTREEMYDISLAAQERGISPWELLHDAVMNDLAR